MINIFNQVPAFQSALKTIENLQHHLEELMTMKTDVFGQTLEEDEVYLALISFKHDFNLLNNF